VSAEPGRNALSELMKVGTANQTQISGGPVQGPLFDFAPVINQFLRAHLFCDIFERDNLDWQSRELATVGGLAATPGVEGQLRSHMSASMRVGLSTAQLRRLEGECVGIRVQAAEELPQLQIAKSSTQ